MAVAYARRRHTLGQGCIMEFTPGNARMKSAGPPAQPADHAAHGLEAEVRRYDGGNYMLRIKMPRRSIYVMSGDARTEFKHAIAKLSTKNLKDFPAVPSWNTYGMRRSLTECAARAWSCHCAARHEWLLCARLVRACACTMCAWADRSHAQACAAR